MIVTIHDKWTDEHLYTVESSHGIRRNLGLEGRAVKVIASNIPTVAVGANGELKMEAVIDGTAQEQAIILHRN